MATKIGQQSRGPMYNQMRRDILARIRRGEFGPGDYLPSESELCVQYGVSVTTARRALLELVKEGVIQRRAGVGTIVSSQARKLSLAFLSIGYVGETWRQISSAMGDLVAGIGECAWRQDAAFSMAAIGTDEAENYLQGFAKDHPADGLLLRTADDIDADLLSILEGAGMPYVVIKRRIPGRRMNCVVSDDEAGARMATSHLLSQGHTRIGFVCAKPHLMLNRERLTGYRESLAERNIEFDKSLVRQETDFTTEMGYRAVRSLLEMESRPSAVFVASDTMALGGYEAARDLGLSVPDDVAFVGYDDIAPAAILQPPLTTVRTSYYEFGSLATQLLIDIIDGRELAPQQRSLAPALIVRESSGQGAAAIRSTTSREDARSEAVPNPYPVLPGRLSDTVVVSASLDGRASSGIARHLSSEGAVLTVSSQAEIPIQQLERTVPSEARELLKQTRAQHGRVDALLYSVSLQPDIDESLNRALLYCRSASAWMAKQGSGSLLILASVDSHSGFAHAAAKAGLEHIVESLATERASRGIRINGLLYAAGQSAENEPESLAATTAFLISDEASGINGEVLELERTE